MQSLPCGLTVDWVNFRQKNSIYMIAHVEYLAHQVAVSQKKSSVYCLK